MPLASFERGFDYRSSKRTQAERNMQTKRTKKIIRRDGFKCTLVPDGVSHADKFKERKKA